MRKITIPVGSVFGKLKTIGEPVSTLGSTGVKLRKVPCRCECGTERAILVSSLRHGQSTSCGCANPGSRTHGCARDPKNQPGAYRSWRAMVQRCNGKRKNYAGRGITMCERWRDFSNFLEDMGERPENHSIERVDVNKGYTPENCKWIPNHLQALNQQRTKYYTVNGKTGPLPTLCDFFGINHVLVRRRLGLGWPVEYAFTVKPTLGQRWKKIAEAKAHSA